MPGEARAHLFQARLNKVAALQRNVWILPPPDVQQFAFDVSGAGERIVVHAFAQAVLVDVSRIEAGGGGDFRIHGSAKGQMPADADAHHAQPAGAVIEGFQVSHRGARVGIVGGNLLGSFVGVATVGAGLIVGQHRSRRLQLMINLRGRDYISVSGEHGCGPPDGRRDLEDFRIKNNAGIFPGRRRPEDVRAHGPAGSRDINKFGVFDYHRASKTKDPHLQRRQMWAPASISSAQP